MFVPSRYGENGPTVAIELASTAHSKYRLTVGSLVGAEVALLALFWQICALLVAKGKVVPATSLWTTNALDLVTVVAACAFAPELEGALLETIVGD